jgi:protein-S-isoprenylcysteine O-methyltransferase Ste14
MLAWKKQVEGMVGVCFTVNVVIGFHMQRYFGAFTLILLIALVWGRVFLLKSHGVGAFKFGVSDKKDFLILPFALFYLYLVFAFAFHLPMPSRQRFFASTISSWIGTFACLAGLVLFVLALVSFGRSFRVGIDSDHPDTLVTTGVFAVTRNPIYVAFALVLIGEFLFFSNWILVLYLCAAVWLFHRQVLREEEYLRQHYGRQYMEYSARVRRYL